MRCECPLRARQKAPASGWAAPEAGTRAAGEGPEPETAATRTRHLPAASGAATSGSAAAAAATAPLRSVVTGREALF